MVYGSNFNSGVYTSPFGTSGQCASGRTNRFLPDTSYASARRVIELRRMNFIIRHAKTAYGAPCDYLLEHGFIDIAHVASDKSIKSMRAMLADFLRDSVVLLRRRKEFRQANILFAIGYQALLLMAMIKFGLIQCNRLYWFGLFLHSPRIFPLFRFLLRVFDVPQIRYIVFSQHEHSFYQKSLGIAEHKLISFRYGHWVELSAIDPREEDYYFSGGASDRDYAGLAEAMKMLPFNRRLVVVGSSAKNNLEQIQFPAGTEIYQDIDSTRFDELQRNARICIVPIRHDTGASGQSVLLRHMRDAKAIIATDTAIIREYLEHGVSALLVKDNRQGIAEAIQTLEADSELRRKLGRAARQRYEQYFSVQVMKEQLARLIDEPLGR